MKMKKGLKIIKAVLIIFILVSTVSLIPVVNAEATTSKYDLSRLRVIKNRLIEQLGEEKYQEIEEEVSRIIHKQFYWSANPEPDSPLYELLKEIAVIIVAVMVLLFGTNPIGVGIGIFACVIILSIPVVLIAVGISILDILDVLPYYYEGGIADFIEHFGLIGALILFILAIPLMVIVATLFLMVDIPVTWFILMDELIQYARPD